MASNGIVQIPIQSFMGINQSINNMSMQYATYAENVDTSEGRWRTAKGISLPDLGLVFAGVSRIDKIIRIKPRVQLFGHTNYNWYVFHDKKIYYAVETDGNIGTWATMKFKDGVTEVGYDDEFIDHVIYEDINSDYPSDKQTVVIFSGKATGCFEIWCDLNYATPIGAESLTETAPRYYFAAMCNYKERLFGVGEDDAGTWNRLYYSQAFEPNKWDQIVGNPDESGGIIDYPTWDNDEFISLVPFGGYLVAFKREHAVVITGSYPGEYNVSESYGTNGVVADGTVAVGDGVIFYLSDHGIGMFDGGTIRNISRDVIGDIFANIDFSKANRFCGVFFNGVYSVSVRTINVPEKDPWAIHSEVIEYDYVRGTFMLRTGVTIDSFCRTAGENLFVAASDVLSGPSLTSYIGLWNDGEDYFGQKAIASYWRSPWSDCGSKEALKSGFRIRCLCTGETAQDAEDSPPYVLGALHFMLETERKTKEKYLKPTFRTAPSGYKRKPISKPIQNRGRQFRFHMDNTYIDGTYFQHWYPIEVDSGVQIETELDSD